LVWIGFYNNPQRSKVESFAMGKELFYEFLAGEPFLFGKRGNHETSPPALSKGEGGTLLIRRFF
jgi:hypothetical protein